MLPSTAEPRTAPQRTRHPAPDTEARRVQLAARPTTPIETLQTLAQDPSVTVRAAVAMNPAAFPETDPSLLVDADDRVRELLASKIARLLPTLAGPDHEAARLHAHRTLTVLASDAATRVRLLATILPAMPEAPRDVILRLAHDPVIAVSDPVLRFSPLLTDTDLLELLATPPHPGTATAIAVRPGLSARIADEIATHADTGAVRSLLENRSAQIQEATLDALIGRAGSQPEWHEPLIRRPILSTRAVRALARLVAAHLIEVMLTRNDLTPDLAEDLRQRLHQRLIEPWDEHSPARLPDKDLIDQIHAMHAEGNLAEHTLLQAAADGDHRRVAAILQVRTGIPIETLDRAIARRSAKALVSLTWRAQLSMRAAIAVQSLLGRLGPDEAMGPTPLGEFPLSPSEMEWQIELLTEPGR